MEGFATFYLRRSPEIRERKAFFFFFLMLLLGEGPFFSFPCTVFWGVKTKKTLSQKGCEKAKIVYTIWCIDLSKILHIFHAAD